VVNLQEQFSLECIYVQKVKYNAFIIYLM